MQFANDQKARQRLRNTLQPIGIRPEAATEAGAAIACVRQPYRVLSGGRKQGVDAKSRGRRCLSVHGPTRGIGAARRQIQKRKAERTFTRVAHAPTESSA